MMTTRFPFRKKNKRANPFLPFHETGEKGSITVLIALLLPVMILMLALVVNIGQLVFTKIKLQNTVDACALSAAAVQAAGLNEIADLNREMDRESKKAKRILSNSGTWYSRSYADNARNFFYNHKNGVIDCIRKYQKQSNYQFADDAKKIARHVKQLNFPQGQLKDRHNIRRLTDLSERFNNVSYRYYTYTSSDPDAYGVRTLRWRRPDNPQFIGDHDGRYTYRAKRRGPWSQRFRLLTRVQKRATPTYAHYELMLPAHPFALGDTIFGGMPTLTATAIARPAGGNIYNMSPYYSATLVK